MKRYASPEKVCFSVEVKVLNAILNDVPEEEIRRIQTIVVPGKHLINHISNFCH